MSLLRRPVGAVLATCVLVVVVIVGASVGRRRASGLCGFHPLPRSAVPTMSRTRLLMTRTVEPEGCGASYRREAVLAASSNDPPDRVLGQAVTELRDGGWSQVECVSAYERCFERGRHFVAMTTPDGARERDVSGYPAPVGTGHAQLLVVVEER